MNKSKQYQHKIVEISFDQNKLNNFSNERGIANILHETACDERIVTLRDQLLQEIYSLINGEALTEHQRKILYMRLIGKTQNEIAEHLGITQSAVHKAMHGNIDYRNNKKRYGGIIKKLKRICSSNDKILQILDDIDDVRNGEIDE
jgi:DNA-binding CsgD family transcriptional regulator